LPLPLGGGVGERPSREIAGEREYNGRRVDDR
jgi:hypothetical protein